MNAGKIFEEDFKESVLETDQISIDRLIDPMGGARGVSNICDFILYKYPCIFYLELKSLEGNTLNFKSAVSNKQIGGLQKKHIIDGVFAGLLVNYRDHKETYFVPIDHVTKLIELGKKSLHINDARSAGYQLVHKKKVTRYKYDVKQLLERLVNTYGY